MNEKVVELLLAEGRDAEALAYAELAKARSLHDLLATKAIGPRTAGEGADLSDLLAHWPAGITAVEYFVGRDRSCVFLVRKGGNVKAYPLALPDGSALDSRVLVADVRRFLDQIGFQAGKMRERLTAGQGFDATWQDTLYSFYRELLPAGILEELRQSPTVVVVPHHILHYFPFAALVTAPDHRVRGKGEMVKPRFLWMSLALSATPRRWRTGGLRQRRNRPITAATALGIVDFPGAPPLPGVARDLGNLKSIFGDRATIHAGYEASEHNAKVALGRSGLLLFATHGMNLADQPLQSHLLLYSDQGDEGQLTAADLYRRPIAADLVVMNACYSGLADRSPLPGDDLFGLQRAFLHSGARTVVTGLWDVYDGTGPELIQGLLERLAKGTPVPERWPSRNAPYSRGSRLA